MPIPVSNITILFMLSIVYCGTCHDCKYSDPKQGVTDPMLYIGMLFSMFAWHVEDHYLYR